MTAETETAPFPLHPVAEAALAAMPEVTGRLTATIDVPPFPRWVPWPEYDGCVPVTERACAALVTGWLAEAQARLAAAAMPWLVPAPVAEPVPSAAEVAAHIQRGLGEADAGLTVERPEITGTTTLTESGHEDQAEDDEDDPYAGTGWAEAEVDRVLNEQAARTYAAERAAAPEGNAAALDLPRPGTTYDGSNPGSDPRTDAGLGQPAETAVIPAVEAATEMFPAVTDSTEGSGS